MFGGDVWRWNVGQIAAAKCRRDERKRRNVVCPFRLYEFRVTCARNLIGTPTSRQRVCYKVLYIAARFAIHIGNMLFDVGTPSSRFFSVRELADFYGAPGVTFSLDSTFTGIRVDTDSRVRVCFFCANVFSTSSRSSRLRGKSHGSESGTERES